MRIDGGGYNMLFQEIGRMKRSAIMSSIVMIAIALIMIMSPVRYMGPLISIMGYALLVLSVVMILDYLESKRALINYIYLTAGIAVGLIGLYVLLIRSDLLLLMRLLFGLWLLAEGIYTLNNAVTYARRAGSKVWGTLTLLAVIELVLGVVLLFGPWWDETAELKTAIGIMLLVSSVISIIRLVLTWPIKNV